MNLVKWTPPSNLTTEFYEIIGEEFFIEWFCGWSSQAEPWLNSECLINETLEVRLVVETVCIPESGSFFLEHMGLRRAAVEKVCLFYKLWFLWFLFFSFGYKHILSGTFWEF